MIKSTIGLASLTLMAACTTEIPSSENIPADIPALAGSEWGPKDQPNVFLAFKADGKAIGSGGCNNFFSTYNHGPNDVAGAGALSFGPIGATKKMCPPEIMNVEQAFFKTLGDTQGAESSHLSLMLTDKDGTPLITLQRRDWD